MSPVWVATPDSHAVRLPSQSCGCPACPGHLLSWVLFGPPCPLPPLLPFLRRHSAARLPGGGSKWVLPRTLFRATCAVSPASQPAGHTVCLALHLNPVVSAALQVQGRTPAPRHTHSDPGTTRNANSGTQQAQPRTSLWQPLRISPREKLENPELLPGQAVKLPQGPHPPVQRLTEHKAQPRPHPDFLPTSLPRTPKWGDRLPLTTGEEMRQPGQSQMGGCTCRMPLDISVFRLFPGTRATRILSPRAGATA